MVTSVSSSESDSDYTRHEVDSTRIFIECCKRLASCRFQLVHSEFSTNATFIALHERTIELELFSADEAGPLPPAAICCVSFPYETSFCAFVGCLVDVRVQEQGKRTVIVTVPRQLTVTNLREWFRIPIVEETGLATILYTPTGQRFTVDACDITEAGMEIEFDAGDGHGLTLGASVEVELQFRGEVVKRAAEVRYLVRTRCGLAFRHPSDVDGRRDAARLRAIVQSLQKLWLKSRLA